jgi:hypothetical protein
MWAASIHMMTAGLLLEDGEKERVNRYLQALEAPGQCLATEAAGLAREDARDTTYATGALPLEVLWLVKGLEHAYAAVETERRASSPRA